MKFWKQKPYYVVMEKVQGEDLFEVMGKGRLPMIDAREIVKQILGSRDFARSWSDPQGLED